MPEPKPQPNTKTPGPAGGGQRGGQQRGGRRRPKSRFGTQLEEKQNLKEMYGIREEQLKRYFREALAAKDETGPAMIVLMERRLDNALFRSGIAETRPQARQLASHRLFTVNGRAVNVPSMRLSKGDVVAVKKGKQDKALFANFEKRMQNAQIPDWLELKGGEFGFRVAGEPTEVDAKSGVDIQAVVELLAR